MEKIVKNNSEGYGYNYASLSDIAKQGYEIPKMKVGIHDGSDYIYYYDKELNEWIQGAKVVVPQSKGMNEAQMYGSALTYARRYTALLSLQLACEDDKQIEELGKQEELISPKQMDILLKNYQGENLFKLLQANNLERLEDMTKSRASEIISKLIERSKRGQNDFNQ